MAGLGDLVLKTSEYRPCLVNGDMALFHRWSYRQDVVAASPMIGGAPGGAVSFTVGIVEMEDGQVRLVSPDNIKFTDDMISGYAFNNEPVDDTLVYPPDIRD